MYKKNLKNNSHEFASTDINNEMQSRKTGEVKISQKEGDGIIDKLSNIKWCYGNEAEYKKLVALIDDAKRYKYSDLDKEMVFDNIRESLIILINNTDKRIFRNPRNSCIIIHDILYKTTLKDLNEKQVHILLKYLTLIVSKDFSREEYIEMITRMMEVNLNWITGDKVKINE